MARRAFARGSRAWGECRRTGDRVLLRELVRDGHTGMAVTREAWEPKHPQETPVDVFDPQVLRYMAPNLDNDETDGEVYGDDIYDSGIYE